MTLLRIVLLLPLLAAFSAAQSQVPTFTTQTNLVLVPALVTDQKGNVVYGLSAKDFVIQDDKIEQPVHLDEAAESEPISLVIAVQSGRKAYREFARMRGLSSMIDPILGQEGAEAALIEFDSGVSLVRDFGDSSDAIERNLGKLRPGDNGAAILDAVDYSVKLLNKRANGRRRVLLLISETRDHGSHFATMENVVTLIGDSNTTVYALTFSPSMSNVLDTMRGSNRNEMGAGPDLIAPFALAIQAMKKNTPKVIAAQTGGEYELFESRKAFESRMIDFGNHLHNRYLLSFEPKNPHPGFHTIQVTLREPLKASVLARSSYWATR